MNRATVRVILLVPAIVIIMIIGSMTIMHKREGLRLEYKKEDCERRLVRLGTSLAQNDKSCGIECDCRAFVTCVKGKQIVVPYNMNRQNAEQKALWKSLRRDKCFELVEHTEACKKWYGGVCQDSMCITMERPDEIGILYPSCNNTQFQGLIQ